MTTVEECPRSAVTRNPGTRELVNIVMSVRDIGQAVPGGNDLMLWPAKWLDIWKAAEHYFKAEDAEIQHALNKK